MRRLPALLVAGIAAAGLGLGTANVADAHPAPTAKHVGWDGSLNSPSGNRYFAQFPKVNPAAHTDYGRLMKWTRLSDGRVLLYEDRVDLHVSNHGTTGYTNVNPKLRRYFVTKKTTVELDWKSYSWATGDNRKFSGTKSVNIDTFLNYVRGQESAAEEGWISDTGYKLRFNAAHNTITGIRAVAIDTFRPVK